MFARLRQFARGLLSRPDKTVTAEQQVQQELAKAASPGMVTTRSQEHKTEDNGLVEAPNLDTPNGQARKRKVDDGEERTPSQSTVNKRRASLEKDDFMGTDTAVLGESLKEEATNRTSKEAQRFLDGIDIPISSSKAESEQHAPKSRLPTAEPPMPGMVNESQGSKIDAVLGDAREGSGANGVQHQSNTLRKRRKTKPTYSGLNKELHTASTLSTKLENHQKQNRPEVKRPTHNIFGSEEPSTGSDQPFQQYAQVRSLDTAMRDANTSEEGSDSGDEVPEVVTASAGLNQARSAAAEAAKAVEMYTHPTGYSYIPRLTGTIDNR